MMMRSGKLLIPVAFCLLAGAALLWWRAGPGTPEEQLDAYAKEYVALTMMLDRARPGELDSYFGPMELDTRGADLPADLDRLAEEAQELHEALQTPLSDALTERQLALQARVQHLQDVTSVLLDTAAMDYGTQASRLFGMSLEGIEAIDVSAARDTLNESLSGSGGLAYRLAQFRNQFLIPADRREAVFERAVQECRERTAAHWQFPATESLQLEWSREGMTPWHQYLGDGQSVLRINPLAIAYLSSAIDVACHETYPGHHAQYLLLEQQWQEQGAWPENAVTLLRSPESALREGAAMLAVDIVFPLEERIAFERDVLAPLAGLRTADVEQYNRVRVLQEEVALSTLPLLRDYNDGVTARASASFRLERDALVSAPNQLLDFSEQYGAYAAAYTLARKHLQEYVEVQTGMSAWDSLEGLIVNNSVDALNAGSAQTSNDSD